MDLVLASLIWYVPGWLRCHTPQEGVLDRLVWRELLAEHAGWRLERNRVTGHARILDPGKVRRAWGLEDRMKAAFDKVCEQVTAVKNSEERTENEDSGYGRRGVYRQPHGGGAAERRA